MSENPNAVTRRLAAILIADVVGYSRHMERDDARTVAQLREIREQLIDPRIGEYGGRIVKTTGDGMLLEFASADAALRCAVDIQQRMAVRNRPQSPDARIEYRMGINLGDVIVDGSDIVGDGVNVAARLETLAEQGGICVSAAVREQMHGNPDVSFDDIGEQQVKNIGRPIRVYRVASGHTAGARANTSPHGRSPLDVRWRWWAGGFVSVVVIGIGAWLFTHGWPSASPPAAPALSAAVMPFAAPGGNSLDQQLADAFTKDLSEVFERTFKYAWIVSPDLAATYKGKSSDPRVVGRELNVRYLVEGEFTHVNDGEVLTTRLVDTTNAIQQWNDQFELDATKSIAGRNALLPKLVPELRDALMDAESRRATREGPMAASATDFALRAAAIPDQDASLEAVRQARKLYEEALRLDPNLTLALTNRASTSLKLLELDPKADRSSILKEMDDLSLRAVTIDRNDPRAWDVRATALVFQGELEASLEANAEALRLDPYRTYPFAIGALALSTMGRARDALSLLERGFAMNPRGPALANLLLQKCHAHLLLGEYDEGVIACERAVGTHTNWLDYLYLTAAYAQKGDTADATNAKDQLLRYQPRYTIARIAALTAGDNPVFEQQREATLVAGLRKAGIPEQ